VLVSFLLNCTVLSAMDNHTSVVQKINIEGIHTHEVVLANFRASNDPLEYLRTVALKNIDGGDLDAHRQKATAIRLLGRIGGTNSFATVVHELDFVDKSSGSFPASYALIDMGETVVPPLFEHILTLDPVKDHLRISSAAWAMRNILGDQQFDNLLEGNRQRIPALTYQVLYARDALR
jgi:hypothetical protein